MYINHDTLVKNGWEKLPKKYNHFYNPSYRKGKDKIISLTREKELGQVTTMVGGYHSYFDYLSGVSQTAETIEELAKLEEEGKTGGWEKLLKEIDND